MSIKPPNQPNTVVHGPSKQAEAQVVVDDAGQSILALLQRAADMAKEDTARAMQLADKLSSELLVAEDRLRRLEAESAQYRDRANSAEAWMLRIQTELEHTFLRNKPQ